MTLNHVVIILRAWSHVPYRSYEFYIYLYKILAKSYYIQARFESRLLTVCNDGVFTSKKQFQCRCVGGLIVNQLGYVVRGGFYLNH